MKLVGRYLRRIPFSLTLAVLICVAAALTGALTAPVGSEPSAWWGAGVSSTVGELRWWTVFSALVVPGDLVHVVLNVLAAVLLLGAAERVMGTARAALAFVVTGAVGAAVGVGAQAVGQLIGEWWSRVTASDLTVDPLTGIVGALVTSTAFMSSLWRRRVRVVVFSGILIFVFYAGDPVNIYRLVAAAAGLLLGALLTRDADTLRFGHSSHRERRNLLAAMVAVTALGPFVALTNPNGFTPLAFVSRAFTDVFPNRAETLKRCAQTTSESCDHDLALLSAAGPGPILLTFLPYILLLVAAIGLRAGRRYAFWLALAVNLALIGTSVAALESSAEIQRTITDQGQPIDTLEWALWIGATLAVPLGVSLALILGRPEFTLVAPREAYIRVGSVTALAFVVLGAVYAVVGFVTLGSYVPETTVSELLVDTLLRFVPVTITAGIDAVVVPQAPLTLILYQWIGVVFWAIVITGMLWLFRQTDASVRISDRLAVRRLLQRGGGGTLGFMSTWPGNVYWLSDDGEAAIAYRMNGGVALALSDPICAPGREAEAIREFATFCDQRGAIPAFYSIHETCRRVFDELGWQSMSVGEETLMHPQTFDLVGKPWQKVRQAMNRGQKAELTTEWTRYRDLSIVRVNQIAALSEQWVSEKSLPEMGFTLGGLEELKDPEVMLMLAIGPDDRLQAVTSWLPMYREGVPVGWTIDFMRRADDSMSGVMEFLIASAALKMKDDGVEVLSLSGAPLAQKPVDAAIPVPVGASGTDDIDDAEPTGEVDVPATSTSDADVITTRFLEFLATTLEPAYGFATLFRFKAKFNPTYETIYLAYPDPLALPAIGIAISRAYLPSVSPREGAELLRTLTRPTR